MDHTTIVADAKRRHPLTDLASFQPFIVDVVLSLPVELDGTLPGYYVYANQTAGSDLVQEPGGRWVSIKRVAYSDGRLFKILTDAGPFGANGPAFGDDGFDPDRYLARPSDVEPFPHPDTPPDPVPPSQLDARLHNLELQNQGIGGTVNRIEAKLDTLATKQQIIDLEARTNTAVQTALKQILAQLPHGFPFFRGEEPKL